MVVVTTPLDDDVTASAAILVACGFELVPLRHPLSAVWHLLGVSPSNLMLVSVIRGPSWPDFGGVNPYRHPPAWPPWTRRLIHKWSDGTLPEAMTL